MIAFVFKQKTVNSSITDHFKGELFFIKDDDDDEWVYDDYR